MFRWDRTASFKEKSLQRSSFQSPLWVLGHYLSRLLRNKMFLEGKMIIYINCSD